MKKTIITLMALAGVAMAESTWEWQTLTLTTPTGGNFTPGANDNSGNTVINWSEDTRNLYSWQMSFDLTVKQFASGNAPANDSTLNNIFGTTTPSGAGGYVLSLTNKGGLVLTLGQYGDALIASESGVVDMGDGTNFGEATAVTLSFTNYVSETSDAASVGGIFSLSVDGTEVGTYTVNEASANTIFGKNGNTKIWTNGKNQYFTNIVMAKGGNIVIPEPATATLSLLALAGLTMRRRRK